MYEKKEKRGTDGIILADEVGLGKTWEALGAVDKYCKKKNKISNIIIFTPNNSLIENWRNEIEKYLKNNKSFIVRNNIKSINNRKYENSIILNVLDKQNKSKIFIFSAKQLKSKILTKKESSVLLSLYKKNKKIYEELKKIFKIFYKVKIKGNNEFKIKRTIKKVFIKVIKNILKINREKSNLNKKEVKKIVRDIKRNLIKAIIKEIIKPKFIIIDEFHNHKEFVSDDFKFKDTLWFDILKNKKIFKLYLSATPFKVKDYYDAEHLDIITPLLKNLISIDKKELENLRENIIEFNRQIISIRNNNKIFDKQKEKYLLKLKVNIERILKKYIIENKRAVTTHRIHLKNFNKSIGKFNIKNLLGYIDSVSIFKNYLKYHRLIYEARKSNYRKINPRQIPQCEQLFTTGNKTLKSSNKYKLIERLKIKNYKNLIIRNHPKLEKLKEIVKKLLFLNNKNKKCEWKLWLHIKPENQPEKFLIYCYYQTTPKEILDVLNKEIYKCLGINKTKISKKILKNEKKEIFDIYINKILSQLFKDKNWNKKLKDKITSYFTTPVAYSVINNLKRKNLSYWEKAREYCKKNDFLKVLKEYTIDLSDEEKYAKLEKIFMNPQKDIIKIYGAGHGGGAKKKNLSRSEMESNLREYFNSPFLPYGLILTNIGAEGINLHKYCRNVIHYDLWWMPSRLEQRTGRVDRVNSFALRLRKLCKQKSFVKVLDKDVEVKLKMECPKYQIKEYFLVMDDTVDEYIYQKAMERKFWLNLFIGGSSMEKIFEDMGEPEERINETLKNKLDKFKINLNP
ncbi:MAG: DEAD/DEAH box helicase family protein [Candidatus Goldbacteria bacterium]|nr:DEAD/DEAH box helicase family protein [Candidatus Goldiibacteriota bacterium]